MKPHKHAELIKAWADGAKIQLLDDNGIWIDFREGDTPAWNPAYKYRVKPQPKPDYTDTTSVYRNLNYRYEHEREKNKYDLKFAPDYIGDLKLTFDGETGKLKSAEVL